MFWQAVSLQLGYNATLVAIGASVCGTASKPWEKPTQNQELFAKMEARSTAEKR